jgi:class 3 adenylate cyclase
MTAEEILNRLKSSDIAVDRLLDECRAADLSAWREHPELYLAFVEKLIDHGHPARALELAREGENYLKDNSTLQYKIALAAARGGNPRYAESILEPLLKKALGPENARPADMNVKLQVDVIALQGRALKDRFKREPQRARQLARESADWYRQASSVPGAAELPDAQGAFPLVNAATMYRVAGDQYVCDELAEEVVRLTRRVAESVPAKGCWPSATLGEAYLLLGRHEEAVRWYCKAMDIARAGKEIGSLFSMLNNLRLLKEAGATASAEFLDEHLGRVVVFSGHMVDSPERLSAGQPARFPNDLDFVAEVAAAMRSALDRLNAQVGFCSLACGGDILFAEAMLARGAELNVVLPFASDAVNFLRTSVDFGQEAAHWRQWRDRFHNILATLEKDQHPRVKYSTCEPFLGSNELFAFSNKVLQGLAVLRSRERVSDPLAVALIDRSLPGLPGGAGDFLTAWKAAGHAVHDVEVDWPALRKKWRPDIHPSDPLGPPLPTCKLKRPVKAMLFADVAGFSGIDESKLPTFLAAYGDYLRDLFASPIGQKAIYANTWGDGLYIVFDRAADAADFAVELVDPMIGHPPPWAFFHLGSTTPFRVGLHAGPVFEIPDLFQGRSEFGGQHVNRAARIEPVTVRGCAYASEPMAALLMTEAPDRFVIEAVGVHSLAKNYDRCPLYRVSR